MSCAGTGTTTPVRTLHSILGVARATIPPSVGRGIGKPFWPTPEIAPAMAASWSSAGQRVEAVPSGWHSSGRATRTPSTSESAPGHEFQQGLGGFGAIWLWPNQTTGEMQMRNRKENGKTKMVHTEKELNPWGNSGGQNWSNTQILKRFVRMLTNEGPEGKSMFLEHGLRTLPMDGLPESGEHQHPNPQPWSPDHSRSEESSGGQRTVTGGEWRAGKMGS